MVGRLTWRRMPMGTEVAVIFTRRDEIYGDWYECEECGEEQIMYGFKFCPSCGGKITIFKE